MVQIGYDTAGEIQNTYSSAHSEFGEDPAFWIRYFSPSPAADIFSSDPTSESEGAWASGGHYVGPVSAPSQSRLSGSAAEGQADAQSYCSSLLVAWDDVGPLHLPTNNALYCMLDQEYSTSLSSSYWNAWANYIANYNFASLGTYPLYPGLYCDPFSPYPNCSTIGAATGLNIPAIVWSSEPEPCGTLKSPPAYDADQCSSVSSSTVKSNLWQFGEQGSCGLSANVDLDMSPSSFTYTNYCFDVVSNP
jgi:hypothetical protein